MKRMICILLSVLMLVSFSGCSTLEFLQSVLGSEEPTALPTETVTDAPASAPTAVPSEVPTEAPTEEPDDANAAFRELDLEIFRGLVTSGMEAYNQYIVADPEMFGIDPDDVDPGWGTLSYDAHVESMNYYRDMLARLHEIDFDQLDDMNKLGYRAIENAFEGQLKFENYYYYDEYLEPLNGYHTILPLSLVCFNVRNADDVESYLYLVEDLARFIGEIENFEEEKAGHGLFMTETALDQVIDSLTEFADRGEDNILITCFEENVLDKARELGFTEAECETFDERNREAVLEGVIPAYYRLAETLEAHRADCSPFVGASERSPEALEYYKLKLMDEGAVGGNIDTIVEYLENLGGTLYYDLMMAVFSGPSDLVDRFDETVTFGSVEDNLSMLEAFALEYYPALPVYSLSYVYVPEDIAEDFSPAAYLTPAYDDYYDNLMLINPSSEGSDDLLTIAHETLPGHMFQFLYARNMEGLSLAQQLLEPTGYAEAWTVFSEYFVANNMDGIDNALCSLQNANSTFSNVFMPAYISVLVNLDGADIDDVEEYLGGYGLEDAADIFYEYAVTMPYYAMSYALGYAYLRTIYESARPRGQEGHRAFFERYLSYGPNSMELMMEYMK